MTETPTTHLNPPDVLPGAPEAPISTNPQIVFQIPFFQLKLSPTNPRKSINPKADAELAKSIKEKGVVEPLLVRLLADDSAPPGKAATYEVVVGSRRYRAAQKADLDEVPCLIREMTDEEAEEIQLIENMHREDVAAIEEAEGLKKLTEHASVESVAKKIGKSASYVYQRLKLCELVPDAKKAMEEGRLPPGHAVMIARLPASSQAIALETCFPKYMNDHSMPAVSVRRLSALLADSAFYDTSEATFPLDDAALVPAAGACTTCPKLAKNDSSMKDFKPTTCTDRPCFESKRETYVQIRMAEAKANGKPLVTIHDKDYSQALPKSQDEPLTTGQYMEIWSKEHRCKSAVQALVVGGYGIGKMKEVCIDRECPKHWLKARIKKQENRDAGLATKLERAIQLRALGYALDPVIGKKPELKGRVFIEILFEVVFNGCNFRRPDSIELESMKGQVITEIRPLLLGKKRAQECSETIVTKAICALVGMYSHVGGLHPEKFRKQAALEIKNEQAAAKAKASTKNPPIKTVKHEAKAKNGTLAQKSSKVKDKKGKKTVAHKKS